MGGSIFNSVGWEHSQALLVNEMCHYSSCVSSSTAWECIANICPTLRLPYRQTPPVREDMGWIFVGHILGMFCYLLAWMNNGSTIQDLGISIWCMLHSWRILCYAVKHIRYWPLSKLNDDGYGWMLLFVFKVCIMDALPSLTSNVQLLSY